MHLYANSTALFSEADLLSIYILFQTSSKSLIDIASIIMCVDRTVLNRGNDTVKTKMRNIVKLEYTGYLYEESENINYHQKKQYVVRIASTNKQNKLLIFCKFDTFKSREDEIFETVIDVEKIIKDTCHQISYLKKEVKRLQRLKRWCFKEECRWEKHFDNLEIEILSHVHLALKHADIFRQWLCIW